MDGEEEPPSAAPEPEVPADNEGDNNDKEEGEQPADKADNDNEDSQKADVTDEDKHSDKGEEEEGKPEEVEEREEEEGEAAQDTTNEEPAATETAGAAPDNDASTEGQNDEQKLLEDVFKSLSDNDLTATLPPEKLSNLTSDPPEETSFDAFCEIVRTTATNQSTDIRVVLAGAFYRVRFETLYDTISSHWVTKMTESLGDGQFDKSVDITKDMFCDVMLSAVTRMSVDAVLEKCEAIMQQTEEDEEEEEGEREPLEEPLIPGQPDHKESSSSSLVDEDPVRYYSDPVGMSQYSPPAAVPHGMGQPISPPVNLDDLDCPYVDFHLDEIAETATNFSSDTSTIDLSKLSVGKRLYYAGCGAQQRKDEYLREERQRRILTELGQMSNPHITEMGRFSAENTDTNRSKGIGPTPTGKQNLEQLRAQIKQQREEREEASMKKVELAPMSKYIVETTLARRYKGPVSGWETHRDRHAAKQVRVHVDTRDSFIPNINRSSANLTRDGKVFSRLYSDAGERTDRQTTRSNNYHSQLRESPKVHTNPSIIFRKSPSPAPPVDEVSPATDDTVVHRLLSAGQVMARKKEKLSLLMKKKEEQFTFKPTLTERSLELAAAYRERKEKEREKRRLEKEESPNHRQHQQQHQQQGTPRKPSHSYSRSRDSSEKDDTFLNRSYRQAHQRKERMSALLAEKKEEEFRHCTFQPEICPNSEALLRGQGRDPTSASPTRIYSRSFFETEDPITPPSVTSQRREASLSRSPFDRPAPTAAALSVKVEQQISAVLEEWNKIQGL
eukprot:TRINITY_DN5531_c0_g1_i1.p1 TRINITY_DN5531_c0_g1~~TRINITY_DN5531_c0_g1_i1.p1  ORF type:complete len:785 (+),score=211.61 TRINITY_DN5531_c0_g1_i1:78-2432(+)